MIKHIGLVVSVCLSVLFSTNAIAEPYMSESAKQRYRDWLKENLHVYDNTAYVHLAISANGCWTVGMADSIYKSKKMAKRQCKKKCKVSSCEIVDQNGKSDFIKKSGSYSTASTSSSTLSGSGSDSDATRSSPNSIHDFFSSSGSLSRNDKEAYVDWMKRARGMLEDSQGRSMIFALATSSDGGWAGGWAFTNNEAKQDTLSKCLKHTSSLNCEIVDLDGQSDFIQNRAIPSSTESTSGSSSSSTSSVSDYDSSVELQYWKIVRDSNDVELLQDYLDEYPNGKFVPLAKIKIKKLKSSGRDN